MTFNYAAVVEVAADGVHKSCSDHAAVKFQETMQEQDQDVEVAEQSGITNGALYAVVPAVASR